MDAVASRLLGQPVQLDWEGLRFESLRPGLSNGRADLGARSLGRLDVDAVRLESDRVVFSAGLPPRVAVRGLRVRVSIDQSRVDDWTRRGSVPFEVRLTAAGLIVRTELGPIPASEFHAEVGIRGGWCVIRPQRAALLGMPSTPVVRFPIRLPLPAISGNVELRAVEHAPSRLHLHFDVCDFEEPLGRGLGERLRTRLLSP